MNRHFDKPFAMRKEELWKLKRRKYSRLTQSRQEDSIFAEVKNFIPNKIAGDLAKPVAACIKDQ